MIDKLTKKRIKVDYLLIIQVLDLDREFFYYTSLKKRISLQRLALAFLRSHKVDYQSVYYDLKEKGITSLEDYNKELTRIAKIPWLDED